MIQEFRIKLCQLERKKNGFDQSVILLCLFQARKITNLPIVLAKTIRFKCKNLYLIGKLQALRKI